jgi:photosystem II stability/assembly factor-like uncharacterized protein
MVNPIIIINGVVIAAGQGGEIIRSLDNGTTWGKLILNPSILSYIYSNASKIENKRGLSAKIR